MAKIYLDNHEIDTLVLTPATGSPVTKSLTAENSYAAGDDGKVVSSGALVAQSSQSVTENGTYDTTLKNSVTVNVPSASVDGWDIYSKELVETWGATVNLKDDTNFDELTPSTSVSTIQLKNGTGKSVSVDFANYAYLLRREEYIKAAYTATPGDKAFCDQSSVVFWFFYRTFGALLTSRQNANTGLQTNAFCHRQYNSSGDPVLAQNGSSYGIYPSSSAEAPSFSSTSATSTTLTIGLPKWSMRGATSYSPVETLEAIDSANSSIEYRYFLYRIPKASIMMTAVDECEYITTNGHLRPLST